MLWCVPGASRARLRGISLRSALLCQLRMDVSEMQSQCMLQIIHYITAAGAWDGLEEYPAWRSGPGNGLEKSIDLHLHSDCCIK